MFDIYSLTQTSSRWFCPKLDLSLILLNNNDSISLILPECVDLERIALSKIFIHPTEFYMAKIDSS